MIIFGLLGFIVFKLIELYRPWVIAWKLDFLFPGLRIEFIL